MGRNARVHGHGHRMTEWKRVPGKKRTSQPEEEKVNTFPIYFFPREKAQLLFHVSIDLGLASLFTSLSTSLFQFSSFRSTKCKDEEFKRSHQGKMSSKKHICPAVAVRCIHHLFTLFFLLPKMVWEVFWEEYSVNNFSSHFEKEH